MSVPATTLPHYNSLFWNYSLEVQFLTKKTIIELNMPEIFVYSSACPNTFALLSSLEPNVLVTKCYNYLGLPFTEEVKQTEMGHLFEHILLEYLCQESIKAGAKCAHFRGTTSWNWKKDRRGVYHIVISGHTEQELFRHALARTILLFETILSSSQRAEAIQPFLFAQEI
jgi:hypothetical protein